MDGEKGSEGHGGTGGFRRLRWSSNFAPACSVRTPAELLERNLAERGRGGRRRETAWLDRQ